MKYRFFAEQVPVTLPSGICPACARRRIPYLPECLCGHRFEPVPASVQIHEGPLPPRSPEIFRVVHWSDLHLGARTPEGLRVEVRVRGLLALLEHLEVNALIVSGDLTRFGQVSELEQARSLLASAGFEGNRLIVVPGNHDVPRGQDSANFREVFDVKFPALFRPTEGLEVLALDSNVLDQRTLFERRWVPVRGKVGSLALARALELCSAPPQGSRLMVLHHHLARLSPESRWHLIDQFTFKTDQRLMAPLLDSEAVLATMARLKITATLHGHKHWYSRTGYRVSSIPVFNAGSVTRMARPHFRIFDFRAGAWCALYRVEAAI